MTDQPEAVVLCGGFGAARFLSGLLGALDDPSRLTVVANTGDDVEFHGLRICPDLDSVLYALAGRFDEERGWGPAGDSFSVRAALGRYGPEWFNVGDEDLALHLRRTELLDGGATLTEATGILAGAWGITSSLLPVSDDPIATVIRTEAGDLTLQDYLVARRAEPPVHGVDYLGATEAAAAPGVAEAIAWAEVVVVAPSNPVISIGPMLAVPEVHGALTARSGPTVAVSPVVLASAPRTGPEIQRYQARERLMAGVGLAHRPAAVAEAYASFIDAFVVDRRDTGEVRELARRGLPVLSADTLAPPGPPRRELAVQVLDFARALLAPRPPTGRAARPWPDRRGGAPADPDGPRSPGTTG